MKPITAIFLGAGQRGADAYAPYALEHPDELKIVAVAEADEQRRKEFAIAHKIPTEIQFSTWEGLLSTSRLADCALVCTQDRMHFAPTIAALEKGYDVLLEKPMSNDPAECYAIGECVKKTGRKLLVCHVLRYTPFFAKLKTLLDEGAIGRLMSIQYIENVGFMHQAHSFVRGNWRNSKESSPMILAKSCHDMDMLLWLADSECRYVSSFGSLGYFKAENAPDGAPERCMDGCPVFFECSYNAPRYYLEAEGWEADVRRKVVSCDTGNESILAALKTGPYGKCVFHCDNDVVDHQVVNMEFANGVTVAYTMCAFTWEGGRSIKLMGTQGQIRCDFERDVIEVRTFQTGQCREYKANASGEGHGGGDMGIMREFLRLVNEPGTSEGRTPATVSVQGHLMAFAAEQSRIDKRVIDLMEYVKELKCQ